MASHVIVTVVGARPQFIKLAPVSRRLAGRVDEVVVHTGQHYDADMSQLFFDELEIRPPHHNLGIGSGSHGAQTARAIEGVERVILEQRPSLVLVYGDTNSTLAAALAAVKLHLPVAHVEAGLRSFNRTMPEEVNRVLTDHCSDLLLAPTHRAVEHLRNEGIERGVHWVGDVMFDAARDALPRARMRFEALSRRLNIASRGFALATIHRAENTDVPTRLREIATALTRLPEPVVLPLHPRTRGRLADSDLLAQLERASNVRLIGPVGYLDMLALEAGARVILTDSGGVQKEGYFTGTPVVTLRDETEWVETVVAGWNQVVGADARRIVEAAMNAVPGAPISDYGEGMAAERVAQLVSDSLTG